MTAKIRVMILEDHQATIDGYRYRLEGEPDIEVAAVACYGEDLESVFCANQPIHVLCLDIQVPNSTTNKDRYPILNVIPTLLNRYPDLRILVLSVYKQAALIKAVMEAGASGYILKDDRETHQNLASVIRVIAAGGIHLSKDAYEQFLRKTAKNPQLTVKQAEMLYLCASNPGWSSTRLGDKLGLSPATVRNVMSQVYAKLGVATRAAAVERARELGLIPAANVVDE
jgi:DNA-binding NarL/FixJ family response regulator